MTYSTGNSIRAADYNAMAGEIAYNQPYPNATVASNRVSSIYGVGYGDRGYGQTALNLPVKSIDQPVTAADWVTLRNTIAACAAHSNTDISTLPASSFFLADNPIVPGNISNSIVSINNSRLNNALDATTLFNNVLTMTRGASWSSSIVGQINVTFSSDDAARYFFNSGGQIRFAFSHPNGSSAQNTSWINTLSGIGNIIFSANGVMRTGTLGMTNATGYYQTLTTAANIYWGDNIGQGAGYTTNDVYVTVKNNGTTTNGAKGRILTFMFTLQDQHTFAPDTVAAGTNVAVSIVKATTYLTGIETPSVSILSNW